jgi:CheY-specific phosphatase CheX
MKKNLLKMAMKNSISDVLETMFFLPMDFSDMVDAHELWNTGKDQILAAKLNFDGPLIGDCIFYIPERLAKSITADFMGKEEEGISDDQVKGTVKEIINMIVGNTFSRYDPEAAFNLGIPELVSFNYYFNKVYDAGDRFYFIIDTLENHLAFQLNVGDEN